MRRTKEGCYNDAADVMHDAARSDLPSNMRTYGQTTTPLIYSCFAPEWGKFHNNRFDSFFCILLVRNFSVYWLRTYALKIHLEF